VCLGLLANHIIAALGDAGSNRWKLELALPSHSSIQRAERDYVLGSFSTERTARLI
jgi:hypothetical protein